MIKKSVFENDLINGMEQQLTKTANIQNDYISAIKNLHSAIDALNNVGLTSQAEEVLNIINKIAKKHRKPKNPTKISDRHTKKLTSKKMLENLKGHGTVFNMADDGNIDNDSDTTFEDE